MFCLHFAYVAIAMLLLHLIKSNISKSWHCHLKPVAVSYWGNSLSNIGILARLNQLFVLIGLCTTNLSIAAVTCTLRKESAHKDSGGGCH